MARFHRGRFEPKNPKKYTGKYPITYRSSWELRVCRKADEHPSVIEWQSESLKIPYRHPFTNKYSVYVPDFVLVYMDKNGKKHVEVIEVKPKKETFLEHARSVNNKKSLAVNAAKWTAAQKWCQQRGINFRVINEDHIFTNQKKRK